MKRCESHNHVHHNVINTVNTSLGIAEWQKVGKQGIDNSIKQLSIRVHWLLCRIWS